MATMVARKFCEKVCYRIVITYRYDKNKNDVAKISLPTNLGVLAIINCDIYSMFRYDVKIYRYNIVMLHCLQISITFSEKCFMNHC